MVRYLKDCFGCFQLRFGVIIIACLEIIFSAYFMSDGIRHAVSLEENGTSQQRNQPVWNNATKVQPNTSSLPNTHHKKLQHKNHDKAVLGAVITVGTLNILFNLALLACAALNKAKYGIILIIWIGWAIISVCLYLVLIVFYVAIATSFLDGTRVFFIYGMGILLELFCIWVVGSYYKYLLVMARGPCQGYRIVFNSRYAEPQPMSDSEPQLAMSQQIPAPAEQEAVAAATAVPPEYEAQRPDIQLQS